MKRTWIAVIAILCLSAAAYAGFRFECQRRFDNAMAESRQRLRMAFAHRDDKDDAYFVEWQESGKIIKAQTPEQLTAWGDLYSCGLNLKAYRQFEAIGVDAAEFERKAAVCITP
jgi:hypothetical protein